MLKNETEKNGNNEKYGLNGITGKIHTNRDGVRAIVIKLRSTAANSSWRFPVTIVKQAPEITRLRLVFLPTLLSSSRRFLRPLQQNRAQSRLPYLKNKRKVLILI